MSNHKQPGWGQIVQLLLRAMDTSPKSENYAALVERMADGIQCLYGAARNKPHPINDAIDPHSICDTCQKAADAGADTIRDHAIKWCPLWPAAAAETVCHEEQLRIWAHDHIIGALSMEGYLRDDMTHDDGIDLEKMIMREIKGIVEMAFDHPEARTIRRT